MNDELFRKITLCHTTMAIMRTLLKDGKITDEDYAMIDTKIAEKYGLESSVIYR